MHRTPFLLALLAASTAAFAQPHGEHGRPPGAPTAAWTNQPLIVPVPGGRGERAAAQYRPVGLPATEIRVFGPRGGEQAFPVEAGAARLQSPAPESGNYHWLSARAETPAHVAVASTVWYASNPGPSPVDLLRRPKSELEILPDPLPREHASYRESEKWRFIVRYAGQPLAGQVVRMETERGTQTRFTTDSAGVATVLFPRDFPPEAEGEGHNRTKAGFVLTTEYQDGERHFVTTFNYTYGPDGERGRSLAWGAAFGLAGMLGALPLLRRRQNGKEQ
ncbi:MAG: hypothetical protein ACK4FP_06610 [Azonexus sp.]